MALSAPSRPAAALLLAALAAGCAGGGGGEAIEVQLREFAIDPAVVRVDEPGTYTFRAVNEGSATHALEVAGHGVEAETGQIAPGESAELTVELPAAGEYELYCPVDGHREQGMEGAVEVGGVGGAPAATERGEDGGYGYGP